jgi:uncharacterized protein YifE (UPF0438 family)
MPLSDDEVLALWRGETEPSDGMELHFLRVCEGKALPSSPLERQWLNLVMKKKARDDAVYDIWVSQGGEYEEPDDYDYVLPEGDPRLDPIPGYWDYVQTRADKA